MKTQSTICISSLLLTVVLIVLNLGCGPSLPPPQTGKVQLDLPPQQIQAVSYQVASDTLAYRLGPGDVISIYVHDEPDISRDNITVRYDGYITYFLVGDIFATGRTLAAIDSVVSEALTTYIYDPEVTVFLQQSNSKRYVILGGVNSPGVYPLNSATRLTDAVSLAGGFVRTSTGEARGEGPGDILADLANSYIIRGDQRLDIDLESVYEDGNTSQDLYLQPDDYIYIPLQTVQSIYVFGEVAEPRIIRTGRSLTLADALLAAGGVLTSAKKSDIRVLRGAGQLTEGIQVDFGSIMDGRIYDFQLQEGDIIYVPRSELSMATEWVTQILDAVQSVQLTRLLIDDLQNNDDNN